MADSGDSFTSLLNFLKDAGESICNAIDIGCHVGDFGRAVREVYPDCYVLGIDNNYMALAEARRHCDDVICATLSAQDGIVRFHYSTQLTTGNSYYLENREDFEYVTIPTFAVALDDILHGRRETFDIMKIDTQGSELDILIGATATLSRTRMMLVEVPGDVELNIGAPPAEDTLQFLRNTGFTNQQKIVQHHRTGDGAIENYDYLCVRPPH